MPDQLLAEREIFRAIFDQAAVGIAEIETQTGRFTRINRKYCEILRSEGKDLMATTFMAITHPDDLQAVLDHMEKLKKGEIHEFSLEKRCICPDGEDVWVNLTVSPLWEDAEPPRHHVAVVEDITRRKRAESALRQSEEQLRLIVNAATDTILTIDQDSRIVDANPAVERAFAYVPGDLVGRPLTILMPPSLREPFGSAFDRYVTSGEGAFPWQGVQRGRRRDRTELQLDVSFREVVSGGNRLFTLVLRDISDRHREEQQLNQEAAEKKTLEKLAVLTATAQSGLTLEEVFERMFEAFRTIIPYDRVGCALLSDDGTTARSVWSRSTLPEVQIPVGYSARLDGSSLKEVLESGRPRILNDLEAYLLEHPRSENTRRIVSEGMRSSLTCPLIAVGKPVGFLFFSSTKPHTYADAHVDVYLHIADHISWIVEKGRLYQALSDAKHELEVRNRFIADVFGRYTSEAIVSRLLDSPGATDMGGETRKVTILFSDLRGFTGLCARLDAQRVVRLLNIHFSVMADVIMEYGGTIDEFQGDAALVLFGAPVLAADDARRALACSVAMQRAMGRVNRLLSAEALPTVEMGIAVHTGEVVAGNIGSHRRAKYGVVGQAVNIVTEMEKGTVGGEILCSEETRREVGDFVEWDMAAEIGLKGVAAPMKVFLVRGLRDQT